MEKLEYYTIKPNLKQIYGKRVTKDTAPFDEKTDDESVTQHFENLTLTTTVNRKYQKGDYEIEEKSTLSVKVPENTVLLWTEENGFSVVDNQITTLSELKKEIEDIEDIYNGGDDNDSKGNERKDV